MSIKTITTDDLRRMKGKEGLVLQGCGGDPQEWVDGINDLLTKEGILLNGSKFENCSVFKHDDLTCIRDVLPCIRCSTESARRRNGADLRNHLILCNRLPI